MAEVSRKPRIDSEAKYVSWEIKVWIRNVLWSWNTWEKKSWVRVLLSAMCHLQQRAKPQSHFWGGNWTADCAQSGMGKHREKCWINDLNCKWPKWINRVLSFPQSLDWELQELAQSQQVLTLWAGREGGCLSHNQVHPLKALGTLWHSMTEQAAVEAIISAGVDGRTVQVFVAKALLYMLMEYFLFLGFSVIPSKPCVTCILS